MKISKIIHKKQRLYHIAWSPSSFLQVLIQPVFFIFLIAGQCFGDDYNRLSINLPNVESKIPRSYGKFRSKMINESSGLVKSRIHNNIYWTHNDSGDIARLFAVDINGNLIQPSNIHAYKGISIIGALNVDWEGIASDNSGNLYIGDIGNNYKDKELFVVYKIKEPLPSEETSAMVEQIIKFFYPANEEPASKRQEINAEALFWAQNHLFIITKGGKSRFTDLYALNMATAELENALTLIGSFDFKGMVTGADATADGKKIAVLTYNGIWVFTIVLDSLNYFSGDISWLPIRAGQCEAICFDGDQLVISNEHGRLFKISLTDLIPLSYHSN